MSTLDDRQSSHESRNLGPTADDRIVADRCVVCAEVLPASRLSLLCDSCGNGIHPSCAGRIERGEGWGNRRLLCPQCV